MLRAMIRLQDPDATSEFAQHRAQAAELRADVAERERELALVLRDLEIRTDELARSERAAALRTARLLADQSTIELLSARLAEQVGDRDRRESELCAALDAARAALDTATAALDAARGELDAAHRVLRRTEGSVSWQLFLRARRRLFDSFGGEHSAPVRGIQAGLRAVGRRMDVRLVSDGTELSPIAAEPLLVRGGVAPMSQLPAGTAACVPQEMPLVFTEVATPVVSIVMPVHACADLTRGALESILVHTPFPEYEMIIVEDAADPATRILLDAVEGARIVRNRENLGYQRSITAGAARARGEWIVLCNNDIAVRPGWLEAMLECAESRSDVGIVTPKYLSPDGMISEAGAIIWRDATGANYLRGEPAGSCHASYRREVDYGSAAALLVRNEVWQELGGFDKRFEPMYYEDADLCFAARARGWRTIYEPRAEVIHFEGSTAGTDESTGHKRNQTANRPRFAEKWREQLQIEHRENDLSRWWVAADRAAGPRVLVVDHTVPTWDQDAGSVRMREILGSLRALGCRVTLLPDNLAALQPYTRLLENAGIEVLYGVDMDATLRRIGPDLDLVFLSRPQPAARWLDSIRALAPQATVLYDTVDLHWLRHARHAAIAAGRDEPVLSPRAFAMRELEHGLMRATDGTIVVTEAEAARVREDVPGTTVHVLPIGNQIRTTVPPASQRSGIVFVGAYRHPPNVDAALLLATEVMPRLWRELPELVLTIVGADPPPELAALASSRIEVRGWVEDLTLVLDGARALLAPLRYGAGLKGKITQALAEGLPVVTTPTGAEGLDATDGVEVLIGRSVEELAVRTVQVVCDDALWERLSDAGRKLMLASGSPAVMATRLRELLSATRPA